MFIELSLDRKRHDDIVTHSIGVRERTPEGARGVLS